MMIVKVKCMNLMIAYMLDSDHKMYNFIVEIYNFIDHFKKSQIQCNRRIFLVKLQILLL